VQLAPDKKNVRHLELLTVSACEDAAVVYCSSGCKSARGWNASQSTPADKLGGMLSPLPRDEFEFGTNTAKAC
jgi:hypothetical protein